MAKRQVLPHHRCAPAAPCATRSRPGRGCAPWNTTSATVWLMSAAVAGEAETAAAASARPVVQPVADHQHAPPLGPQPLDQRHLVDRRASGLPFVDARAPPRRAATGAARSPEASSTRRPIAAQACDVSRGVVAQRLGEAEANRRAVRLAPARAPARPPRRAPADRRRKLRLPSRISPAAVASAQALPRMLRARPRPARPARRRRPATRASGWRLAAASDAAARQRLGDPGSPTSASSGSVSVPVLSNTTVSTSASRSSAVGGFQQHAGAEQPRRWRSPAPPAPPAPARRGR